MPTVEYLNECFMYDRGKVYWKVRPAHHFKNVHGMNIWNSQNSNKEAGYYIYPDGKARRVIRINKKMYYRYHIVWALHKGALPSARIDHKNRNTTDDTIDNLREATSSQNAGNAAIHKDNKSGYKGVSYQIDRDKWRARICVNGKSVTLGYYGTREEAHASYCAAAQVEFGDYACAG